MKGAIIKKLTAAVMIVAALIAFCACDGGKQGDTSLENSGISSEETLVTSSNAHQGSSDTVTSQTLEDPSSENTSVEEGGKSEAPVSSENTSSEPHFTTADAVISEVSVENAGQDAGISLNDALNLYRATVNDGRICVWKKTENKEKRGVDVELLMYDEVEKRLEYVITYTVENRKFSPFSIENDGFGYQYFGMTDSKRDVFGDIDTRDLLDLTGDTPQIYLNGKDAPYYSDAREKERVILVEYGEDISINDGVYEVYGFHPEYGEIEHVDTCGNYAVMIFETDEHFTESTSTILIYDYINKTELVIDTVEGEDCGATMHEYVDAWFADEEHLVVYTDDDGDTYIYETETGKKTVIEGVGGSEYFTDGVTRMNIEYHNGYILWHERDKGLFSMSLEDYSVISLAEEIYLFEIVNDKLLVKTGGTDYRVGAGNLYISDGAALTLIDSNVYCYFFVNDTVYYQVGTDDGYTWVSSVW